MPLMTQQRWPAERLKQSLLYAELEAECEEIRKHKWLESEKAGHDIGYDRALLGWIRKHRRQWKRERLQQRQRQRHGERV